MATSPDIPSFFQKVVRRLNSARFHIAQKLLFFWIRPNVLDCNPEALSIKPDDSVCYALPFRSIADLVVIDNACKEAGLPRPTQPMVFPESEECAESRSFFFLAHPEGLVGRKSLRKRSLRMERLFPHQGKINRPIKIVPVSLFWGHQPDREKSVLKLFLSENWNVTSGFKKLLAGILHRRHILVQFSQPILLPELITTAPGDEEIRLRKLSRLLRVHFRRQKQAILGPDLSHRRTLINTIITSSAVKAAIVKEASEKGTSQKKVEKQGLNYAHEIVSHQTYRVVRLFYIILSWLWNKLYDGINLNGIEKVKALARDHEIIYVPCHRSHVDYLLLSYVLYVNGLTPPHIAAGKNLNLPLVGALLRRGGAFFMRRSFKGDPLYKTVFDEYMHIMMSRGYSMEYFIEGGRSRTGRTLNPRTGMLSITLASLRREPTLPVAMMPVYFGYERILEDATYMNELRGMAKKEESLTDIYRAFKLLKNNFGQVSVNFGKPLILQEFAKEKGLDWSKPGGVPDNQFRETTHQLAVDLATRINEAAAVNPVNLVATIILSTPKQTIEESRLITQLNLLLELLRLCPFSDSSTVCSLSAKEILIQAEKASGIERSTTRFGDILSASREASVLLAYYRNTVAHIFALPSLLARCTKNLSPLHVEDAIQNCLSLYPYLKAECFLPWKTNDITKVLESQLTAMKEVGLLSIQDSIIKAPPPESDAYACLSDLAEVIEPTLERYYLACILLRSGRIRTLPEAESAASDIAARLSVIHGIDSPEFFDNQLFGTFLSRLEQEKLIAVSDQCLETDVQLDSLTRKLESLLDQDIAYKALQAVETIQLSPGDSGKEKDIKAN